jgi:hypothetical protein
MLGRALCAIVGSFVRRLHVQALAWLARLQDARVRSHGHGAKSRWRDLGRELEQLVLLDHGFAPFIKFG